MIEKLHSDLSGSDSRYSPPARRRKVPGWARLAVKAATEFIYPASCLSCRAPIDARSGLCPDCWRQTGFIAPPACSTCGVPIAWDDGADAVCESCAHAPPAWSRGVAAVTYEGVGRKLVLGLKHGDRLEIARHAALWMLQAQGGAGARLVAEADIIAPAPLHWRRMISRRFNQAGELAREISILSGRKEAFHPGIIRRSRFTAIQGGKNRRERLSNVAGAFDIAPRWRQHLSEKKILLVDDVLTTGATLSGCAEAFRTAGATEIFVLVFARVAREELSY